MEIGEKLRLARQNSGKTQEQVGEAIGVSRQTISNWENGRSLPDVVSVIKLSDLYQVSLDELLKGDGNMLRHIEETTNTVKSRQRLGKLVQTLSFLVIWAVCVAVFWLGGGEAGAMGYSLIYLWGVLPLAILVVSIIMGCDPGWTQRKWLMILYFGGMYTLAPWFTFSLANTGVTGNFHLPDGSVFLIGLALSAFGMSLGSLVGWLRKRGKTGTTSH